MKKTLTIVLLSISLSGFSQTEKGDWVITPTVGWNTIYYKYVANSNENFEFKLPTGFHKYLSDRFVPINFGLQFIINNPRSEIESPR